MPDLNAIYEVITFSIGDTKAGSKMGKLLAKNTEDGTTLNCIMWEETLKRHEDWMFRSGNKIKLIHATYNEKYNNCLVNDIDVVEEAKFGLDENEQTKMFNEICERVTKFEDEKLKKFIANMLAEHAEEFKTMPAAKLMHHNYLGGLLEHSHECMTIADKVVDMFPKKLNRDEVVAASIIHDFGKIFEYTINKESGIIDYAEDFYTTWISHSQWGFTNCMVNGFPRIAKMIAAHHGRTDWGSMIDLNEKNLESYVYVLHHIDDLSAKFGKTSVSEL